MAGIKEIRIDKEKEPLGMDEKRPVISWSWQEGTKSSQKAYQIIVSCRDEIYWDSQRVEESASHAVVYEGRDLQPLREYELLLKVWCADGKSYYGKSCFETGFLGESIKAWEGCRWIGPPEYSLFSQVLSVFTLSAKIRLKKGSRKAGIIFGAEDDRLLDKNRNELGVGGNHYILVALDIEKEPAQLEIYRVGYTKEDKRDIPFAVIRLLNAEGQALLKGIKYNSDFAADWPDVNLTEPKLVSCKNAPVRIYEEIAAKTVEELDRGVYLYDLGQEIAGTVKITLHGNSGDKIRIRYGEILYPHKKEYKELAGRMLQVNLREASNTDYVILHNETEVFCPKFTSHGYRYIEISGTQSPSKPEEVVGCLLSSVREIKGKFVCDNPLINRLVSNISYSMLCNYMSIPTDCPQRNERMGWLGDTHIFAGTSTYQADVENFLRRNILAIKDLQREDGRLPNIAPFGGGFGGITYESALILMVYELYLQYGDKTVVEENYQAMSRWMDSMQRAGMPGEVYVGPLGDWLALEETDLHLIWNAFYIRDARYMAYFARLTNKAADVQKYEEIERKSRDFWNAHYVDKEKKITLRADKSPCDTQASYVIGLSCHAFDASLEADMAKRLAKRVEEAEYRLSTGFFATGDLNSILCRFGYEKEAFCLISQTEYPSWLYPVLQGATTVWERWNGYTVKEGFGGNNAMNSFNHYSFGSVLSWLYEDVLGIRRDEQNPAYKSFTLSPNCYGFSYAKGQIPTPYGLIESSWEKRGDRLHYRCKVPANSRARIKIANLNQEVEAGEHCFVLKMQN